MSKRETGLKDKTGHVILEGEIVALNAMTADDSMGVLPNGWTFLPERDRYEVYWDERISNWSLRLPDIDMTKPYDVKYLNHAVGLLHHDPNCIEVVAPTET